MKEHKITKMIFLNKYEMFQKSAEICAKNCSYTIKVNKKVGREYYSLWITMNGIKNSLDVENK